MISVILIEPEFASNVGAVARIMNNFNVKNLVLINPKCKTDHMEATMRAKAGLQILKKAKIGDFSLLEQFDVLIATASKKAGDKDMLRSAISPKDLTIPKGNIGLVFGREETG